MIPDDWMEVHEAELTAILFLEVSDIPHRRGNFTCLARTESGAYIPLGQVAN
jgi:hypothetical protein